MKLRNLPVSVLAALLIFAFAPRAEAADRGDFYFGYSRVGANLYDVYTSGMNGWQAAAHIKPFPFVGFEADLSRYTQNENGSSQQVLLAMFGPRVTVHAAGFGIFVHGLGGIAHQNATVTTYGGTGYNAASYAFGAGVDIPLVLKGLKARATADYLGNGDAPPSSYSPSPYRFGVGIAYHF